MPISPSFGFSLDGTKKQAIQQLRAVSTDERPEFAESVLESVANGLTGVPVGGFSVSGPCEEVLSRLDGIDSSGPGVTAFAKALRAAVSLLPAGTTVSASFDLTLKFTLNTHIER